jgi:hypothetical protein
LACIAAVTGVFAAIKLSPATAHVVERLTYLVSLNWRLWSDPTDLIALCMLPVTWRVWEPSSRPAHGASVRLGWRERLAGITAILACLGTSMSAPRSSALVLVNRSHDTVTVQIFRPPAPLDCTLVQDNPRQTLTAESFAFESCRRAKTLWPPVSLDPPRIDERLGYRVCDAVLLRTPGLDDTIIFWNDIGQTTYDTYIEAPADEEHTVYLEQVGDRLFATPSNIVKAWQPTFTLPEASCEAASP